ncbi:MAG: hypothetical protein WC587_03000 [Candidatus Paceibacterota bacterium]
MRKKILLCVLVLIVVFFVFSATEAKAIEVQTKPGDIVLFGYRACPNNQDQNCPGDDAFLTQSYLVFFQQVGKVAGIYKPLFGEMNTLDLFPGFPSFPGFLDEIYVWGHIEIATGSKIATDSSVVVLRLKQQNPAFVVDLNSMVKKFIEFGNTTEGYNQPFIGGIKAFIQLNKKNGEWMSQPGLEKKWADAYGIFVSEEDITAVQYSPVMGTTAHTDIDDPGFWKRDTGCSPRAFWSLIWGWYKGAGGQPVRDLFLNNMDNVNAIDALAPGQIGWWLLKNDLAEVVQVIR